MYGQQPLHFLHDIMVFKCVYRDVYVCMILHGIWYAYSVHGSTENWSEEYI